MMITRATSTLPVVIAFASVAVAAQGSTADSITKPKLRGKLRELWEYHVLQSKNTPSMLQPLATTAASATPLFTVGSTFDDGYSPPGILDGMGAYKLDNLTVRVLVNHELEDGHGYSYTTANNQLNMTGARISYFDVQTATPPYNIVKAGLAYDTIYTADGHVATNMEFLQGNKGFARFCSGRLVNPPILGQPFFPSGSGIVDRVYFAPEEVGGLQNSIGGAYWALDVENRDLWSLASLGRGAWENLAPVDTGSNLTVGFVMTDDTKPFDVDGDGRIEASPLYMYIGVKNPGSAKFLERNGLGGRGKLYVLVLDDGRARPSQFAGTGFAARARWIQINNTRGEQDHSLIRGDGVTNLGYDAFGFPTQGNLWLQANNKGSFGFSRPEDVHENPNDGTTVVVATTGVRDYDILESGDGADTVGTLYSVRTDFHNSLSIQLSILYDGDSDATRSIRSPDNLYWSTRNDICITEDPSARSMLSTREQLFGAKGSNKNEASVICIQADNSSLDVQRLAVINRAVVYDPSLLSLTSATDVNANVVGAWESSGIIEVTDLFATKAPEQERLFLVNVQAHGPKDQDTFGFGSRLHKRDLVEGGQMILLSTASEQVEAGEEVDKINDRAVDNSRFYGWLALPFVVTAMYLVLFHYESGESTPHHHARAVKLKTEQTTETKLSLSDDSSFTKVDDETSAPERGTKSSVALSVSCAQIMSA